MFSNSSSFLGGAQSARPTGPPYGQPSYSNPLQSQQQQSNAFIQQPTEFSRGPMQPLPTGYPVQGQAQSYQATMQQPFHTGYKLQNQQSTPNQPPLPLPPSVVPQRTGLTSSQIAQSFQSPSSLKPAPSTTTTTGVKIPKIRLSFLTAQDQAKFEQLFKSAVGDGQALDGRMVPHASS